MKLRYTAVLFAISLPAISFSAGASPEALKAWDDYIQQAELRTISVGSGPFLWVDGDAERSARARQGEILVIPDGASNGMHAVPHGLIHDWLGAVFIPGVTMDQVFGVVDDYSRYSEFYRPSVIDAVLLRHTKSKNVEEDRFRVRYQQKVLFISDMVVTEYQTRRVRVDERHSYSIAQSTQIQEFSKQDGKPDRSGSDDESRYVWRIYTISKYEQRDGGVYLEQENIVLSRSIPFSLRWLVEPVVRQLSKELTASSLRQTSEAVRKAMQNRAPLSVSLRSGG